jgi:hypothetical protein
MRSFGSRPFALFALVALLASACIGRRSESAHKETARPENVSGSTDLHRPLHFPTLAPRTACPVTPGGRPNPDVGIALGSGPAYPVLGFEGKRVPPDPKALVPLHTEDRKGNAYWHKTLWAVDPRYDGSVLIRGWDMDLRQSLWFVLPSATVGGKQRRVRELRMRAQQSNRWRYGPSLTIFPGPGCYAFQVDGTTFSDVIIFQAARTSTA